MQWVANNWLLLVTAVVAVYGAVLATLNALPRRERVKLVHPFWTVKRGDQEFLRVDVVNQGRVPVFVRAVKLHAPGGGLDLVFETVEPGVSKNPIEVGDHRLYQREQLAVESFVASLKDTWMTVESNRGEIARRFIVPSQLHGPGQVGVLGPR